MNIYKRLPLITAGLISFAFASFFNLSAARITYNKKDYDRAARGTKNLENTNLEGVDFSQMNIANLNGVSFKGANLKRAKFDGKHMVQANFENADLEGTTFNGTDLSGIKANEHTIFKKTNLSSATLNNASLNKVTFDTCDLSEATFTDSQLNETQFHRCSLDETKFIDSELNRVKLIACKGIHPIVQGSQRHLVIKHIEITDCEFIKLEINNALFHYAKIMKSKLNQSLLKSVEFYQSSLVLLDMSKSIADTLKFNASALGCINFSESLFRKLEMYHAQNNILGYELNFDYSKFIEGAIRGQGTSEESGFCKCSFEGTGMYGVYLLHILFWDCTSFSKLLSSDYAIFEHTRIRKNKITGSASENFFKDYIEILQQDPFTSWETRRYPAQYSFYLNKACSIIRANFFFDDEHTELPFIETKGAKVIAGAGFYGIAKEHKYKWQGNHKETFFDVLTKMFVGAISLAAQKSIASAAVLCITGNPVIAASASVS